MTDSKALEWWRGLRDRQVEILQSMNLDPSQDEWLQEIDAAITEIESSGGEPDADQ